MKHYLKLSGLFLVFTMAVTLWMSFELGLMSFGKLEAAEETKTSLQPKESKESKEIENTQEIIEKKEVSVEPVLKVASASLAPPAPSTSPVLNSPLNDDALTARERQLLEKEEFLKKQSEYYEKVIVDLKDKLTNLNKENKQNLSKSEGSFEHRLKEKEADWKNQLAKKDLEVVGLKKELTTWKDARAELFRGLYEKMESKKAAKILETMDVDLSNKIIASMKQDKAAEIMSKMIPERAKLITEKTFSARELSSQEKVNNSQTPGGLK